MKSYISVQIQLKIHIYYNNRSREASRRHSYNLRLISPCQRKCLCVIRALFQLEEDLLASVNYLPVSALRPLKLRAILKRIRGYFEVESISSSGVHINSFLIESIPLYNSLFSRKTFVTSTV